MFDLNKHRVEFNCPICKFLNWGIPLTGVTTRCSLPGYGGLPEEPFGAGAAVFDRGGLPRVSVRVAVAGRFPMPSLLPRERVAFESWADTLYGV